LLVGTAVYASADENGHCTYYQEGVQNVYWRGPLVHSAYSLDAWGYGPWRALQRPTALPEVNRQTWQELDRWFLNVHSTSCPLQTMPNGLIYSTSALIQSGLMIHTVTP